MRLMGVDVGFSKNGKTTGIACLDGNKLTLECAGTGWESRKVKIPVAFDPCFIALDGPLLPPTASELTRRNYEIVFIHAPFHNRCKPGLSHWGFGLELRRASAEACAQFGRVLACPSSDSRESHVSLDGHIVEAFPNAFLAVLLPEEEFLTERLRRGRRFDWLYERMATTGKLELALSNTLKLPDEVWRRLKSETNHELRAALVCLLTAALAARRKASVIGDSSGGWFWLPPWRIWQPWAKEGFGSAARAIGSKGQEILTHQEECGCADEY